MAASPSQSTAERRRSRRLAVQARAVRARNDVVVRGLAFDALVLALAMLATAVSADVGEFDQPPLPWAIVFLAITLGTLLAGGAYRNRLSIQFLDDLRAIVSATAIAAMTVTFLRLVFTTEDAIGAQEVRAWLFSASYLAAGRAGFRFIQARARRRGEGLVPALIVGAGHVGRHVAARLADRPEFGLRPVAFLDDDPLPRDAGPDLPVVGFLGRRGADDPHSPDRLESVVHEYAIRHVIITFSLATHERELEAVRRCLDLGVSVSLIPRLFEGIPDQTTLDRLGGIPLIAVNPSDPRSWQFAIKYALDRVLALAGGVLASPVLALAAVGTLLSLGRPILFRQPRVGIDGHRFDMLKFRTMRPPAGDEAGGAPGAGPGPGLAPGGVEGVDRRTRFGSFLRSTSLDELPQLINVLRGDMSLVGPRPERPEYVERFGGEVRRYADRHRVKSGITGWAQIHRLRGQTSIADRVEWDNYYIENWSPWLDLKILLLTVVVALRDRSE